MHAWCVHDIRSLHAHGHGPTNCIFRPSGIVLSMGFDHIQRPFVHGLWVLATVKPPLAPCWVPPDSLERSWFRSVDLPIRARPQTETIATGPCSFFKISTALGATANFFEDGSKLMSSVAIAKYRK